MVDRPIWTIKFIKEELYLLAGLLQSGNLIGFEDPFTGQLSEETEYKVTRAGISLLERGVIQLQTNNDVVIDSGIAAFVNAITTSDNLIVLFTTEPSPSFYIYHVTPNLLIEQTELPDGAISLTAIQDLHILQNRLLETLNIPSTVSAHDGVTFKINKKKLLKAEELAKKDADACKQFISNLGIPKKEAATLSSVIHEGVVTGSFTIFRRDNHTIEHSDAIHWFNDDESIWLINQPEQHQASSVQMKSITLHWLQQRIEQVAYHLYNKVCN